MTGTFYNDAWYLSHSRPLAASQVGRIVVIADRPTPPVDGVRCVCPPAWAVRIIGRASAKLIWMIVVGIRERADVFMGFHLFPGAESALVAARLLGARAVYQMTGGPIEIEGGGWRTENTVMGALGRPSRLLERLSTVVARRFDLIVVRGSGAARWLAERDVRSPVAVITASASIAEPSDHATRPNSYDLVFVGRLTEIKRPLLFVEIVARVRERVGAASAVIAGDGPMREQVIAHARRLGVEDCIDVLGRVADAGPLLTRGRVFVLTSRSEGMSIAMLEAMAAGLPAVVSDVGDLGDVVRNGENGYLIAGDDPALYAERVVGLLTNEATYRQMSAAARAAAQATASMEAVAGHWREALGAI